jgi:HAD superfamily hydrolase (TIGR01458 family)
MAEYRIGPFKAALIDLEGTVFAKGHPIANAVEAIARLRAAGIRLRFLSNADSKTASTLSAELRNMGIPVAADELFTAASAAQEFLRAHAGKRCHCLMSRELAAEFHSYQTSADQADYVVVGDCRDTLNYEVLNQAFRQLIGGADLIALQRGRYFIREDGWHLDTGGVVALLEYSSGKTAKVLGKPAAEFFLGAATRLGVSAQDTIVVGDDVDTDIRGAANAGMRSVLVRTGKYSPAVADASLVRADLTMDSIAQLADALTRYV